ncbi:TrkH family potassium uptake protein [Sediminispirochaeta smaragdinae]|uniref:Potassium uptake protein, TrkH family n=1 Tax=Sediminispirochaeta smaragdinae (strain DSM 11293 / JCM 15392 / SEBR 4228) TaxID=573413 RepID=E1R994_SEDSS|nr:TrkH family potassium uptake protein [Sediminispirochaeta smaragdinae]ADK83063.1 potassium uptake protein, TrkH family [Sediminispirochaeta smaragdinae DSM 11293]
MKKLRSNVLVVVTLILSVITLFIEQSSLAADFAFYSNILDFIVLFLLLFEVYRDFAEAKLRWLYFRRNILSLLFVLAFVVLFVYNKLIYVGRSPDDLMGLSLGVVIVRNIFILLKTFSRIMRLNTFVESISVHPAQTILFSFLLVILTGALYLMAPFTTISPGGLGFLDALFTSTSAVCVTGLIVVDTATVFTFWGHLGILILIQIGGLSIMIISYFTIFLFRRQVSLEEKLLISYMLSEKDMTNLAKNLRTIIFSSFFLEAAGALLLYFPMKGAAGGGSESALFLAVFHAVSAFCNAGFALFSDSLEQFRGMLSVNLVVAALIIIGGISFAVISDLRHFFSVRIVALFRRRRPGIGSISLNSRLVLVGTAVLLLSGTYLVYGLEHTGALAQLPLAQQYLSAFFQSVTLRTAGFNTIPFDSLKSPTLLVMIVFMFIGAASGSTAGGVKINNIAIVWAYIRSVLRGGGQATIMRRSIEPEQVNSAFLVLLFGVSAVFGGTILLSASERAPLDRILFEAVSAFGTVGLSTGITAGLSSMGKWVIISLMFMGRLGPLTILAAVSRQGKRSPVAYPTGNIST